MFSAADISVVIPSYNAEATIRACLDGLRAQHEAPFEVILVDSSGDRTAEITQVDYPWVRLLCLEQQTLPGPARNAGARLASRPILAFLDADCVPPPGWTNTIAAHHSQGHRAVGGGIQVAEPDNAYAWAGHMMEFREFSPAGEPRWLEHVPSCNISYRRDLFLSAGGFPEEYYPQEDLLFDARLNRQGVQIFFDPLNSVRHFCRGTLRGYLAHQRRIGRVTFHTLRLRRGQQRLAAINPVVALLATPLLGLVKATRTAGIFHRQFPLVFKRQPRILALIYLGAAWWASGYLSGGLEGVFYPAPDPRTKQYIG